MVVLNSGVVIASIVILATGGPSTVVLTLVGGVGGLLYYIWSDFFINAPEQGFVREELARRSFAEVQVIAASSLHPKHL